MTNRLAEAKSLYLRKHAENPIDWWSWCDEALATAREQNKPIFLSIGYSSCHWCTVMEGEAFSDLAIAEYMNANFLPIKVDREERPDIDSIYMQALQMMSGQGGWPLNVFVSPDDLVPFYAGTYFPVESRYGRPGFLQVLQALRRYYDTETEDLNQRKALIVQSLATSAILQEDGEASQVAEDELLHQGWEISTGVITSNQSGNRFPMIPYAELALRGTRFLWTSRYDGKTICTQRGLDLALGGIYDHVGGGFHRYTVDPTWTVPHFEKMLYDNGQILEYLANLWSDGVKEPAFLRAVAGTVQWLGREMTAAEGYFYAAQDADSFTSPRDVEPEEGAFYVWSYSELEQVLSSEELGELQEQFTVTPNGNFEGKNVLQRRHQGELSASIEVALSKLFAVRYGERPESLKIFPPAANNQEAKSGAWPGRIPAVTDTKMIVAWNSLMISGLARAGTVFQEPLYLEMAAQAANFILEHQFKDGRFHRLNYQGEAVVLAQSEDYALFIKALLDLHAGLPGEKFWLDSAIALQDEFNQFLWSVELGGYYNTSSDASQDLIVRERSYADNATPSANGVAIANLVRLSLLTDNLDYLDLAEQGLKAFSSVMAKIPQACPSLFTALDWYRHSTLIRSTVDQINPLLPQYLPVSEFVIVSDLPPESVGLVCQGFQCLAPAESQQQLWEQVQQSQTRG
ncbi:thioredoxin domain-containing protein [Nodularia harveyana UHCC-0300]|uniref:Thioredoxin domain-containing protein n=1 Tax=Nodularia harveyana UHCC-0300 TaxID=2974287 RepID=A0ABU5UEU4_9CYAN|nr:thioredoxin domain-containing protein [Nodularia harveyana]MEA5580981.1 thioredoxin domain-containing protein [Nodularia harveyana UHCC-0300]